MSPFSTFKAHICLVDFTLVLCITSSLCTKSNPSIYLHHILVFYHHLRVALNNRHLVTLPSYYDYQPTHCTLFPHVDNHVQYAHVLHTCNIKRSLQDYKFSFALLYQRTIQFQASYLDTGNFETYRGRYIGL